MGVSGINLPAIEISDDTTDASSIGLMDTEPLTSTPSRIPQEGDHFPDELSPLTTDISACTPPDQSSSSFSDSQQLSVTASEMPDDTTQQAQHCPINQSSCPSSLPNLLGFKLVGDNIDKQVSPRYMRFDCQTRSLHYFHSFAAQDRIDFSHLSDIPPPPLAMSPAEIAKTLLPSPEDNQILRKNFATHVSQILITHMPAMKLAFEDSVDWHIPHLHDKEMSRKSNVVCFIK